MDSAITGPFSPSIACRTERRGSALLGSSWLTNPDLTVKPGPASLESGTQISFLLDLCSPSEREHCQQFKCESHTLSWLRGRSIAKRLLCNVFEDRSLLPQEITILSKNSRGQGDRPSAWHNGQRLPASLSISHSQQMVLVALSRQTSLRLGVDLVDTDEVTANVQRFWFTPLERAISDNSVNIAARIWAAKETAYKAMQEGESFCPLRFEVRNLSPTACQCYYTHQEKTRKLSVQTWQIAKDTVAAYAESWQPHTNI